MSRLIQSSAVKRSIPASTFPRNVEDFDFAAKGQRGGENSGFKHLKS